MRANEFYYWLQGFFELSNTKAQLSMDQAACIIRHIDLVEVKDERMLEMRILLRLCVDGTISLDAMTVKIKQAVHDQFVHVIDPQAGGAAVQAMLNMAHAAPGAPAVMRC